MTATPPAPWTCRARAVLWLQRAPRGLPPTSPWHDRALGLAAVAFVDYLDTPVGPYHEVLVGVPLRAARPTAHVPFIAVDSVPSMHGGRDHWALPKTLATFEGDIGAGSVAARSEGWALDVRAGRLGPPVPLAARFWSEGPLGRYATTLRAVARPARVRTRAEGTRLGPWLRSGQRVGMVLRGTMRIDPPGGPR